MREVFVKTVNCHLGDRLQTIQAPALLLWGDKDTAISRYQMNVMERNIPNSQFICLEDASHYGHLDEPQAVNAHLRHFLGLHAIIQTAANETLLPD